MPLLLPLSTDQRDRLLPLIARAGRTILERQALFEAAGLELLLPKLDLNTTAEDFAAQTVRVVQRHGEVAPQRPALISLLETLKEQYAGDDTAPAFLDELLALTPVEQELPDEEEDAPVKTVVQGNDNIVSTVIIKGNSVVPDITVGKNIIKIGKIVVPIWMFVAIVTLPFVVAGLAYWAFVPAKMQTNAGQFNVAVAEFGALQNGKVQKSEEAQVLGRWVSEGLLSEKPVYDSAFGNPLQIWYDGLSPLAKRTTLGTIEGSSEHIRQGNAEELAIDVNANVVIYGVVEPMPDGRNALTIEFYVRPDLAAPIETHVGHYRVGDPIVLPPTFDPHNTGSGDSAVLWEQVTTRGRAIAWLVRALDRERRGLRQEMVAVLERAEDNEGSAATGRVKWPEKGAGKEVLYTLLGEAQLEIAYQDRTCAQPNTAEWVAKAETSFQKALTSNASYAFADMGMGNVFHQRAQCLLTTGTSTSETTGEALAFLDEAASHFQAAQRHAVSMPDPDYALRLARIGIAPIYRLQAVALGSSGQATEAATAIANAQAALGDNITALPSSEHRLLAKSYLIQGNVYVLEAALERMQDKNQCRASLQSAITVYEQCEEEGKKVFQDVYLQETLILQFCTPQKENTRCIAGQGTDCGTARLLCE